MKFNKYIPLVCLLALGGVNESLDKVSLHKKQASDNSTTSAYQTSYGGKKIASLGYSINAPMYGYYNFETTKADGGYSIIDENYLMEISSSIIPGDIRKKGYVQSIEGSSVKEFNISASVDIKTNTSDNIIINALTDNAFSNFNFNISASYEGAWSTYNRSYMILFEDYNAALPNNEDYCFRENYVNHLSSGFEHGLKDAFEKNDFKYLFINYGTHIITAGTFGGAVFANSTFSSYKYKIDGHISFGNESSSSNTQYDSSTATGSKDDVVDSTTAKSGISWSVDLKGGYEEESIEEKFVCYDIGGVVPQFYDKTTFQEHYSDWAEEMSDSNTDAYTMVRIQKLVPLWNLLPDEYNDETHINIIKEAYNNYSASFASNDDSNSFEAKPLTYSKQITESEKEYQSYYDSEVNGDENAFKKNPTHTFKISDYLGFSLSDFANYNYSLKMVISMDIKEHYDGYQHIYLYSGTAQLKKFVNEHGGRGKYAKYATGYFTYDVGRLSESKVQNILNNDSFTIMTGADGVGKNDWYYKNIKVEFQFSL